MRFLFLLVALATGAPAAVKDAGPPLPPSGKWTVHAEENLCLLSHAFGSGADQIIVGFQPIFSNETMEILVLRNSGSDRQDIGKGSVQFGPSGRKIDGRFFTVPTQKDGHRYTRVTVSHDAFVELEAAKEMAISAPPYTVRIALPPTTRAIAAFRQCEEDLLRSWGIDPASAAPDRSAVPINPARAFSSNSYPDEARRNGWIGRVVVVVQVDANGAPTACRTVVGVNPLLNDATCTGAMRRLRYRAGTDSAGKPAASVSILAVNWQMS